MFFWRPSREKLHSNEVIERVLMNEIHKKVQAELRETKRYGNTFQS